MFLFTLDRAEVARYLASVVYMVRLHERVAANAVGVTATPGDVASGFKEYRITVSGKPRKVITITKPEDARSDMLCVREEDA